MHTKHKGVKNKNDTEDMKASSKYETFWFKIVSDIFMHSFSTPIYRNFSFLHFYLEKHVENGEKLLTIVM